MADGAGGEPWREPWLRTLLRCPGDHAELRDTTPAEGPVGLACTDPGHRVVFPVLDGVPVLLLDDAVAVP